MGQGTLLVRKVNDGTSNQNDQEFKDLDSPTKAGNKFQNIMNNTLDLNCDYQYADDDDFGTDSNVVLDTDYDLDDCNEQIENMLQDLKLGESIQR